MLRAKFLLMTAFALMLIAQTTSATVMDGNQLLRISRQDGKRGSFLNGYVAGMSDALEAYDPAIPKCIGVGVRMSQLTDSLILYLEKNPQERHKHPLELFSAAIKSQWGCK